jgi:hypothetical protein
MVLAGVLALLLFSLIFLVAPNYNKYDASDYCAKMIAA